MPAAESSPVCELPCFLVVLDVDLFGFVFYFVSPQFVFSFFLRFRGIPSSFLVGYPSWLVFGFFVLLLSCPWELWFSLPFVVFLRFPFVLFASLSLLIFILLSKPFALFILLFSYVILSFSVSGLLAKGI